MKIAAAVLVLIATFVFVDGMFSKTSVGETIKTDYLKLDSSEPVKVEKDSANKEEEVIEDWIDTLRRKRTRRQSRFC
jgi:hypothetical protein